MNEVIHLSKDGAVATVILEDRESKNTFSHKFITEIISVFEDIQKDQDIKVVIVHGYDNYFCCGGTKEELLKINSGATQFTDLNFYDLLLRCEIPVISAMQGHSLGGGLAFGSYADVLILSEESIYSANFMKYGFTPGMGANLIIPTKFGEVLGREMLMSAATYYGKELKEMGAPLRIVKKQEVLLLARKLAVKLADKPRLSLMTLKKFLNRKIQKELPKIIEAELAMHKITFSQPEVRERINKLY
ncbi:putative polyketide biosynthesis enoyl-CoA isomerase PksI [Gammaproteobacteria bacterium]